MTVALVLGAAECLWNDMAGVARLLGHEIPHIPEREEFIEYLVHEYLTDFLIVACNDGGTRYPGRLDHWASFHAHEFGKRSAERERLGGNMDFVLWSNEPKAKYVTRVYKTPAQGSSGWLTTMISLDLVDWPILCGIPLDPNQRHIKGAMSHRAGEKWHAARNYQPQWDKWKKKNPAQAARVRSMSGWTRTLLGAPDEAWLTTWKVA